MKKFFFKSYVIKKQYLSEYYKTRTEENKSKNFDKEYLKISVKKWYVKTPEDKNGFCYLTSEDLLSTNIYHIYNNNSSEHFTSFKPDELKWLSLRFLPISKFILLLKVNNVAITIYTSVAIAFLVNLLLYN